MNKDLPKESRNTSIGVSFADTKVDQVEEKSMVKVKSSALVTMKSLALKQISDIPTSDDNISTTRSRYSYLRKSTIAE